MITKEKSQRIRKFKYLLVVPVLCSMLLFSSFTIENSEKIKLDKGMKIDLEEYENLIDASFKKVDSVTPIKDVPFAKIDEVPYFSDCTGNQNELKKCLQEGITAHVGREFNSKLANSLGLEPGIHRIFVIFKINSKGNIEGIRTRSPHKKLDEEAIRVIKLLPRMIPGKHQGKLVNVKYSLPIAFKVEGEVVGKKSNNYVDNESIPFSAIDEAPIFPGCEDDSDRKKCLQEKITQHVSENFNSDLAKDLGLSAEPELKRVYVLFTIDKNGEVSEVKSRAPHKVLEEEAIRVVKSLPKMIPGKHQGNNVSVKYAMPIELKVE